MCIRYSHNSSRNLNKKQALFAELAVNFGYKFHTWNLELQTFLRKDDNRFLYGVYRIGITPNVGSYFAPEKPFKYGKVGVCLLYTSRCV